MQGNNSQQQQPLSSATPSHDIGPSGSLSPASPTLGIDIVERLRSEFEERHRELEERHRELEERHRELQLQFQQTQEELSRQRERNAQMSRLMNLAIDKMRASDSLENLKRSKRLELAEMSNVERRMVRGFQFILSLNGKITLPPDYSSQSPPDYEQI
jgi:hypothetical protein